MGNNKKIERFEDIIAWQKAKELSVKIYELFGKSKEFAIRDQIIRASISIMNNIAEGYERKSNKEFSRFLFIAKASCGEVRSMLILLKEIKIINDVDYAELLGLSVDISKMLSGFIKKLK